MASLKRIKNIPSENDVAQSLMKILLQGEKSLSVEEQDALLESIDEDGDGYFIIQGWRSIKNEEVSIKFKISVERIYD